MAKRLDGRVQPKTFQELYDAISTSELDRSRRREIQSALKSAARWFGVPMSNVLASPAELRERFKRLRPATVGVGEKRFANVRSSIMFALGFFDLADRSTHGKPMSGEWLRYFDAIPDIHIRRSLSRLFRFCSVRGISVSDFDDGEAGRFFEMLMNGTLRDPFYSYQKAIRSYNRLGEVITNWPGQKIDLPSRRDQYRLPEGTFTPSFIIAVDAFLNRQRSTDPFDQSAPPRPLRESTLERHRLNLLRSASALVLSGHDPAKIVGLDYLVDLKHAEQALGFILSRREGREPRDQASHLAKLLAAVAKYALNLPEEHVRTLSRYSRRLKPDQRGLASRSKERLLPLRDEANIARLCLLPNGILEAVKRGDIKGRRACLRVQLAVAISILTYCPLRISNLAGLRLDRHLRWTRPGMSGKLYITLTAKELKNDTDITFPLPKECADLIRIYFRDYRDGLGLPASDFLFPGRDPAKAKQSSCLSVQIRELTHDLIGFPCTPHIYRHLVHLVVLRKFPGAFGMISRILGHKSIETTMNNYAHEATAESMRTYQQLVSNTRKGGSIRESRSNLEAFANAANDGFF